MSTTQRRYRAFAWGFLAYAVLVVLWGAFVRATGSGAGCGEHWPLCNGEVVPRSPAMETLVELTHRITSGLAWLLSLVGLLWARAAFPRGHRVRTGALCTLVFMTTEGLVGAALVLFGLVAEDTSGARGVIMALHLVNTFLLLGSMTVTARFAGGAEAPSLRLALPRTWLVAATLLSVLLLGVSGAIAALGDTLFPASSLADGLARDLSPSAHVFERLRALHSILGLGAAALVIGVAGASYGRKRDRLSGSVVLLVLSQVGLGILNVTLLAPVWLQLVHLLVADAIWILLVMLALDLLPPLGADSAHHDLSQLDPARGERVA